MSMHRNNALILLSGGLDSTCLLPYYLGKGFTISCLWINYNQLGSEFEEKAATQFCRVFKVNLIKQAIDRGLIVKNKDNMEYLGRNLLLISMGLSMFPYSHGLICSGIRYSSNYNDCRENFIQEISSLIENISNGLILLDVPFYNYSKKNILSFALEHNIDVNRTYSCIRGLPNGCGKCISCVEREKALKELNI